MVHDKLRQDTREGRDKHVNQERRRRCKRKSTFSCTSSSSVSSYQDIIIGKTSRESKLASQKREQESRDARTRRRKNGGSLSSRGSATGMQCGLCAVLAGLFRRAMCIAGSRRGSGESCYQELATEMQHDGHVRSSQQQPPQRASPKIVDSPIKLVTASRSRSGSFGSIDRLNESIQRERSAGEIKVDSAGQNAVFVRISEDASLPGSGTSPSVPTSASYSTACDAQSPPDPRSRLLSEPDRLLIENLNVGRCRSRNTGRFLTMHKRRRKRLITRSLNQEHALIDDIFHGQVQCVLQKADNWRFNAFTLETVTGGRSLPVLCVHLFQYYGLLQRFSLDVVRVWKLFALIEEGYHSTNPYHNSIHATDVTQAMHCFLQEKKIKRHLSSLEIMASLIAAVTHDLDHPGVNQPFLVATSNHLATLYENTSVLENHHWRSAIGCLLESGVSEQLPAQIRPELQRHISSLILATDITRQQEFLTRFKSCIDNNALDMERPENRHFILQISLKCADISNPCRPWDISRKWSYKVCEEFFRQGDYERKLNLPVTPLCDRQTMSIPRIQVGFFEFVVTPLYEEWHRFLGDGLSVSLMLHLRENHKRWDALAAREAAEETRTEMSDLEPMENSTDDDEDAATDIREDTKNLNILLPDLPEIVDSTIIRSGERRSSSSAETNRREANRRHSVPLGMTKTFAVSSMIEENRRESLPCEDVAKLATSRCPIFRLDSAEYVDEALREMSSLSLLSSRSSFYESAGNASFSHEQRPVSAENLLPEPSIASITSSDAATRLTSVLQPDMMRFATQTKYLTRQSTFPPLQPYVRIRYMSTTAEMSKLRTDALIEADDSPSSSSRERSPIAEKSEISFAGGDKIFTEKNCPRQPDRTRKDAAARSTKEHAFEDNRSAKKRELGFSELGAPSEDPCSSSSSSSFVNDFPRRHSIQAIARNDDGSSLKNRRARPSSAQAAYPTKILYATLVGATKIPANSTDSRKEAAIIVNRDYRSSDSSCSRLNSRKQRDSLLLPSEKSIGHDKFVEKTGQSEPRRYSSPATQVGSTSDDKAPIRRFTAIPVTSELPARKFFIGSPPDSPPPRLPSVSFSSDSGGSSGETRSNLGDFNSETIPAGIKRDSDGSRQKSSKIAKLSDDGRMKENLDPRTIDDSAKSNFALARRGNQGWARRRGSAPVGLLSKLDDCPISGVAAPRTDRHGARRGSVPTDIIAHQVSGSLRAALGPRGENVPLPRRASLPQEAAISNLLGNIFLPSDERENFPAKTNKNNNNNVVGHTFGNNNQSFRLTEGSGVGIVVTGSMPSPRRGSVPADISELRRDLFGRNSVNGKTRNRKKTLRRRSSGGPEMFSVRSAEDGGDNGKLTSWKREMAKRDSIPEPSIKRRGSLPVEMISIFHPGTTAGARRSSLWRF